MKEIVTYMLETMACGAVLMLAYGVLLERKVPFRVCRVYLPAAMAVSALIPVLNIPVWAADTAVAGPVVAVGDMAVAAVEGDGGIGMREAALAVYAAGVVLSLGITVSQFLRIRGIGRRGEVVRARGPRIVRAAERIASFSFFGTVYISAETEAEEMKAIMAHECSHIRHGHSAERLAMEMLKALMWWNPFVWIAQRRLAEVHEYEADADVIRSGYDMNAYIMTILKSLLGYSPDIANSLRDSLTKKRFEMMTTRERGGYVLLRTLAVVPVTAALLCTFSFTVRAAEYDMTDAAVSSAADGGTMSAVMHVVNGNGTAVGGAKIVIDGREYTTDGEGNADVELRRCSSVAVTCDGYGELKADVRVNSNETADRLRLAVTVPDKGVKAGSGELTLNVLDGGVQKVYAAGNEARAVDNGRTSSAETEVKAKSAKADGEDGDGELKTAERMPVFQGGDMNKFRSWVMSRLRYPEEALKGGKGGRVILRFVVGTDGAVEDVAVIRSFDEAVGKEVAEVLKSSPKWTPGMDGGKAVRVEFVLPIEYRMAGDNASQASDTGDAAKGANKVDDVVVVGFGAE